MSEIKKFNNYNLTIKVITPVHIGSGDYADVINSFEYKDYIYGFNFVTLIDILTPDEVKKFVDYFNQKSNKKNQAEEPQSDECDSACEKCLPWGDDCYRDDDLDQECEFREECQDRRRCINPDIFKNHCKKYKLAEEESFITKIKQISTYKINNESRIDDKKREFIMRGANGFPYIPGSSLKGAIVSAFMSSNKGNFSLENNNYLVVGDAVTSNPSCTTFHRLHEQSRKDISKLDLANFMNPCEMLDMGTEFTCKLTTQNLTKEDFILKMKKHYMNSPRYINMEINLRNFLENTKETYDFLLPLGKFKGREFNLDNRGYETRYRDNNKAIKEAKATPNKVATIIGNKGLATKRRVLLDVNNNILPIGWVGVNVTDEEI